MAKQKTSEKYPRTVAAELLEAWQRLKRRGDGEVMAEELQYSRPVIDRALNYGYVTLQELPDKINKWLKERLERERAEAADLTQSLEEKN